MPYVYFKIFKNIILFSFNMSVIVIKNGQIS